MDKKPKQGRGRPAVERKRGVPMQIRLTDEESAAFKSAAESAGLDLSNWVRLTLRKAAGM